MSNKSHTSSVDEPITLNQDYKDWVTSLKQKFKTVQLKAAVAVNQELLQFYWELGEQMVARQHAHRWGDGFLLQLSRDLQAEFPGMKGFSRRNMEVIRQWHRFYSQSIAQQPVAQLAGIMQIPWGHNQAIINKCKQQDEALYYVRSVLAHNWSRSVLVHQIESGLYQREGKAITNFALTLPMPESDLAQQTLKDPYILDFLTIGKDFTERELETKLVEHITQFLLELGAGFAYVGKQVPLQVGAKQFYLDLLFYHLRLHCYVVVELKTVEFEPEHAGKLNFYLKAVDQQMRGANDAPTVGLLLCKSKDRLVAEYALSDISKPMGIAEYKLTQMLPETLKSNLPSIEEIEAEFAGAPQ
jgi:predicted nuclease of restriction endonuclease-like (RecB) superfamily